MHFCFYISLPSGHHEPVDGREQHGAKHRTHLKGNKSYDGAREKSDSFDDSISDALSANSDPVFRWLKDAV